MYLYISVFLLLPYVLFAEDAPEPEYIITKTYTLTTTQTYTTTVSAMPSAIIYPHINQTMPTGNCITASASIPAPSSIYIGDAPRVDGPPASPKGTTPIMSGNAAGHLCGNKALAGVFGLAAILVTW